MWRTMIYGILMWAVTLYAFRRGGWAEKVAASGLVVGSYLAVLLLSSNDTMFQQVEVRIAFVDLGYLCLLVLIALRSRKFWPLWLTAFQGVTLLAHFAPYVHVTPYVYQRASALWSWPMLIVLTFAVHKHHQRTRATSA